MVPHYSPNEFCNHCCQDVGFHAQWSIIELRGSFFPHYPIPQEILGSGLRMSDGLPPIRSLIIPYFNWSQFTTFTHGSRESYLSVKMMQDSKCICHRDRSDVCKFMDNAFCWVWFPSNRLLKQKSSSPTVKIATRKGWYDTSHSSDSSRKNFATLLVMDDNTTQFYTLHMQAQRSPSMPISPYHESKRTTFSSFDIQKYTHKFWEIKRM